ncbi:YdiU family protein [Gammaproteobacteria bacterium AS21]|jgi:uncharacterized protein YdiU (UPF0061 family)
MSEQVFNSGLNFDNSYAQQLDGFSVSCLGDKAREPKLLALNKDLAQQIGLDAHLINGEQQQSLAAMLSGGTMPEGAQPIAQAYAGHQFGGFSPQLGDGRAVLLGEVITPGQQRFDIQLKGSGRTVFSRSGDGKSALGPVLREYLVAEAMHALAVPTTRALAMVSTGETVMRQQALPGAVLTRVAASHIRIGTFQFFSARDDYDALKKLADYAIERHYKELQGTANAYLELLTAVCDKQAYLIAKWMNIGFVHGVMNTDNMTISGETIDYGPCAFMDGFDPSIVYSSIDHQGRYAYQNQPTMALWNLARFAETLLPLLDEDGDTAIALATDAVTGFDQRYHNYWLTGMRAKMGIDNEEEADLELANELLAIMAEHKVDYTQLFRALVELVQGNPEPARVLFSDGKRFYIWQVQWAQRLSRNKEAVYSNLDKMRRANPVYIPRNHLVENAISQAQDHDDMTAFNELLALVTNPFMEVDGKEAYEQAAPADFGHYKTFCGT